MTNKQKVIYNITKKGTRMFWTKVGIATANPDGSLEIEMKNIPTDGKLHIRDYVENESINQSTSEENGGSNQSTSEICATIADYKGTIKELNNIINDQKKLLATLQRQLDDLYWSKK